MPWLGVSGAPVLVAEGPPVGVVLGSPEVLAVGPPTGVEVDGPPVPLAVGPPTGVADGPVLVAGPVGVGVAAVVPPLVSDPAGAPTVPEGESVAVCAALSLPVLASAQAAARADANTAIKGPTKNLVVMKASTRGLGNL
jgi:hypothetical protein